MDPHPVEPNFFAVTCSVRVQIYNAVTRLVVKNLSKFQQQAFGGSFRKDGRLLVAGDEEHCVRLFDVSSKNILRLFKGHTAPVHRTFFTCDTGIVSFSDDRTVKVWDIPSEKAVCTFEDHTDYIRAGCVSPISPDLVLSAGYDNIVRMYDSRAGKCVLQVDHESPVESIVMLPSGGIFITAGGTDIKVWDALAGGASVATMVQHHKTVTCLRLASNAKRLISGSLDKHCKVFDVATYQPVHNIDCSSPILSLGISEGDKVLTVGMVDGTVAVYRRDMDAEADAETKVRRKTFAMIEGADQVVTQEKKEHEARYDKYFRKYEYTRALDDALRPINTQKRPENTVAVIRELIHRQGLQRALAGRPHVSLIRLIRFIRLNIGDYRFTSVLIDAGNILLDVYEDEFGTFGYEMSQAFSQLAKRLETEKKVSRKFLELRGAVELLLSASNVERPQETFKVAESLPDASEDAIKKSVISVE